MNGRRTRAGFTLLELVLALALLAFLMVAVFQLFDRCLSVWRRGETARAVMEQATTISDLIARDCRGLEGGARGDLVAEWVRFDTDGDGLAEAKWPRLRLVRQASVGDVARLQKAQDSAAQAPAADDELRPSRGAPGLVEVVWLVTPASLTDKDARSEGVLWRGERLVGDTSTKSFFANDFIGTSNRPPAGATDEVSGGILWCEFAFASQTSVVHDGWQQKNELAGVCVSWDALGKARPDRDVHFWNERQAGMPSAVDHALLPRRIRIRLEIERPIDRVRRTRLIEAVDNQDGVLRVDEGQYVPAGETEFVLVEGEWMKLEAVDGSRATVRRAQRGTQAVTHAAGSLVHWGRRLERETTVATYREDWDL